MIEKTQNSVESDCRGENMQLCPKFTKTFSILGKKWNGLIIEVLLENGPLRFKDLSGNIEKCSDRVLVERLKELEGEHLVQRVTFCDSALIEYRLTDKGSALGPVMTAVHNWADDFIKDSECQ